MNAVSINLLLAVSLWLGLCVTCAIFVVRRSPKPPLLREQALLLTGLGLLAIAPCTFLVMTLFSESPSLFASVIQVSGGALLFAAAYRARQARLNPEAAASRWVYPQKSAVVILLALGALAYNFFGTTRAVPADEAIARFIAAIVLLVILLIVGHIVIAVLHAPANDLDAPRDERDRAVELYSMRNAYYALTAGFLAMPAIMIAGLPLAKALSIWFALLLVAEIIYYSSIIAYYRFGTD